MSDDFDPDQPRHGEKPSPPVPIPTAPEPPPARRLLDRIRQSLVRRVPFGRHRVDLVYSRAYQIELPGTMTDPLRGERILTFLLMAGLTDRRRVHAPGTATFQQLRRVHSAGYLEALARPGALVPIVGLDLPDPLPDRVLAAQRAMAGGTALAVRLALAGGEIAVNLGGGLHHAFHDRGERFCAINDVAVAIAEARTQGLAAPVLIVDLDLHDGDGTRTIFAGDPSIQMLSIHNLTTAPVAANATVVELGGEVEDAAYLTAVGERLPELVARVRPGLAIYLAGCDPAADDALGNWRITPAGMLARDRLVVDALAGGRVPVPLAVVLAGGYGGRAWTYTARFLAWLVSGRVLEPPSAAELTLERFRGLAALLSPHELTGEASGDDGFGLTAEDLAVAGGIPARNRFLGYYSPQGLELALERAGLLERVRARGFPHLVLDVKLDNPGGETLRLIAPGLEEPLIELRARRDRAAIPGLELLRIEWLLLQNPRARFTRERPRLPGQRHPGLGLLQEVMALMVLACERVHLDGVLFVPAYFHTAAQGKRLLRFLSPEADGRFRALEKALSGLTLPEAAAAVEGGRVIDAATGRPFRWEPQPLLLPVSAEAKARMTGDDYEEEARAAEAAASFVVRPPAMEARRERRAAI